MFNDKVFTMQDGQRAFLPARTGYIDPYITDMDQNTLVTTALMKVE